MAEPLEERYGGRVVVEKRGGRWLMRCDCGAESWCRRCDVRSGRAGRCLSCAMTKHGHARRADGRAATSRLYNIWRGVLHRCRNPSSNRWEHYGGRGITVCDAWAGSFEVFAADVGDPPSAQHTLDRIDVDGHYEPGNTRWATAAEQMANRRCSAPAVGDDFLDEDDHPEWSEAAE